MRIRILGALATLLAGAGLAAAGSGPYGSMSIFEARRLRRCEQCAATCDTCCPPTYTIPSPTLFRAEVGCPTWVEAQPLPPIKLLRAVPPPVEVVPGKPPCLELVRGTPPPVEIVSGKPPPVELFRLQPAPLECAPPVKRHSVTLFHVAQPPTPCLPPPVCAPCYETVGH
jgi:hypothetical protein